MAATVKTLLPNTETEIFYNWNDLYGSEVKAVNITLCNTSDTDVKVHLGFVVPSGLFIAGAVLSFATVPANSSISIEVVDRVINTDQSIRAWAEVPKVISLSVDLVGDINQTDIEPIVAP